MNEDSKKRQELLRQLTKQLEKKANEGIKIGFLEKLLSYISSPKRWDLVEKIVVPTEQVETKKFIICFDYLNEDQCNYLQFDQAKTRALIGLFRQVTSCEVSALPGTRIIRGNIQNNPPYDSLFTGLSPETELKETELPNNGRVYFFIIENKFNIVSIESNHRNLH